MHLVAEKAALFSAVFLGAAALVVEGNAQSPSLEETLIDVFLGNCVRNLPNVEKIRAASRVLGWKSLSRDAAVMFGPIDPRAEFEGWLGTEKSVRYVVGISLGSIGAQPVTTCAIAQPEFKQVDLLRNLEAKLKLKYLNDEKEAGQRYRSWTSEVNGYSMMIMLTTLDNINEPGGSLSAAVKIR